MATLENGTMSRYLVSAAAAAVLGLAAFTAPATADPNVGFSVNVGGGGYHDGYYAPRYNSYYHAPRPGVRVYTGRSAYREDCSTKKVTTWKNGVKRVKVVKTCD
jgi:hypothetical protein